MTSEQIESALGRAKEELEDRYVMWLEYEIDLARELVIQECDDWVGGRLEKIEAELNERQNELISKELRDLRIELEEAEAS